MQRVLVTGASGFVGAAVVEELVSRDYAVNALIHSLELRRFPGDVRSIKGGLFDPSALNAAVRGCDAVIHLVGIIAEDPNRGVTFQRMHVEATRRVVDAAVAAGVQRFIHMSALGTRPNAVAEYHKTKWLGEQIVRASGLNWTIFQPSMIHGPEGEFMRMETRWAKKQAPPYLFMPYFGAGPLGLGGAGLMQPVFVKDVGRAFAQAIGNPGTTPKTYGLAGAERFTWPEFHKVAARAIVGKNRLALPIPAWYAKFLCAVVPTRMLPFNRDQITMSQEDNTCDMAAFRQDFGWEPVGFSKSLADYAARLIAS
jgi:NADH dehydrogenase